MLELHDGALFVSYDPKTGTIHLGEGSDFLADSGIRFVYELREGSLNVRAPDGIREDWKTITNWLECPSGELTEEHHEKISNAWKAYLAAGIAPSLKLQSIFDDFHRQYKSADFDVGVNKAPPEVIGVFDRMLASDEDISIKRKFDFEVGRKKLEEIHGKSFRELIKRWFCLNGGKPHQTDLEKFCEKLTMDTVARVFESKPNSLGLAESFALMLLNMANEFLVGAKKEKLVSAHAESAKPNVVLFEVVTFLWAALQVPVMRWAEDDMGLDEDSEICNNISATLFLTYGIMEQYWPGISLEEYASNRIYDVNIDESAAKLAVWIYSDAGLDFPAASRKMVLDNGSVPMMLSCQLFAQYMVPATLEALKRQIAFISTRIKK